MKKTFLLAALAFVTIAAVPAFAQGGCGDTPENPTLILGGLASGAFAISTMRTRILARRALKKQ
jgi:XrtJ-associated TM-motif-TM protein